MSPETKNSIAVEANRWNWDGVLKVAATVLDQLLYRLRPTNVTGRTYLVDDFICEAIEQVKREESPSVQVFIPGGIRFIFSEYQGIRLYQDEFGRPISLEGESVDLRGRVNNFPVIRIDVPKWAKNPGARLDEIEKLLQGLKNLHVGIERVYVERDRNPKTRSGLYGFLEANFEEKFFKGRGSTEVKLKTPAERAKALLARRGKKP